MKAGKNMSVQHARAIINPAAGGHSTYIEWPLIKKRLIDTRLLLDEVYTEGKGHAIELATKAANSDYRYIIAVGGDGTINEVVNGILNSAASHNTTLGIVSAGTTCSFARSVGIPSNPIDSCRLLASPNRLSIDVGIVEYTSSGQKLRRYFVNEADLGFGATVVEASKQVTNYFGRQINYLPHVIGGLSSLISYKNKHITLRIENQTEDIYDCAMLVIANGTHFGGGMQIAPTAKPDDGLLDMVIFGDIGKSELLKIWPMTYKGSHVSNHKVRMLKIKNVVIECAEKILVEADGELLGESPVSFSVVPSALTVVV
ncbi:diacylglycerol/lipid kinase family protein [Chloroflexota bacterium]